METNLNPHEKAKTKTDVRSSLSIQDRIDIVNSIIIYISMKGRFFFIALQKVALQE